MTDELVKTVVLNLPNFVFAGLAIMALYRINERLVAMIDRLCKPCEGAKGES